MVNKMDDKNQKTKNNYSKMFIVIVLFIFITSITAGCNKNSFDKKKENIENFLKTYYTVENIEIEFPLPDEESYFSALKKVSENLEPYVSETVLEKLTMNNQIFTPIEVAYNLDCKIEIGKITISEKYSVDKFIDYSYTIEIIVKYNNGESDKKELTGECIFTKKDTENSDLISELIINKPFTKSQLEEYITNKNS